MAHCETRGKVNHSFFSIGYVIQGPMFAELGEVKHELCALDRR